LEETDVEKRLPQVLELLKKEHLQAKLQQQIADEVEKQVTDRNRQAMLYVQILPRTHIMAWQSTRILMFELVLHCIALYPDGLNGRVASGTSNSR
jgi:hypothetical protein